MEMNQLLAGDMIVFGCLVSLLALIELLILRDPGEQQACFENIGTGLFYGRIEMAYCISTRSTSLGGKECKSIMI